MSVIVFLVPKIVPEIKIVAYYVFIKYIMSATRAIIEVFTEFIQLVSGWFGNSVRRGEALI